MVCRLASVPVLTVSVLKRLQDLGKSKKAIPAGTAFLLYPDHNK
jgi:hypothetical protein